MLHRLLMLVLFLTVLSAPLRAQDDDQVEEPLPPRRSAPAKLGAAGGFLTSRLFVNLDPINEVLRSAGAAEFDQNGLYLLGGQGYAYILVVENLRIGGIGQSGSIRTKALGGSTRREVDLSVGFGGVTIDYVFPIRPRLDVTLGLTLGSLGMTMKISRDNGSAKVWGDIWGEYGSAQPAGEFTRTLSGSFFMYQPTLNVEYAVLRWLGFRAGVAYSGTAGGSWQLDETYDLFNVPSSVNSRGVIVTAGIYLGTFVY